MHVCFCKNSGNLFKNVNNCSVTQLKMKFKRIPNVLILLLMKFSVLDLLQLPRAQKTGWQEFYLLMAPSLLLKFVQSVCVQYSIAKRCCVSVGEMNYILSQKCCFCFTLKVVSIPGKVLLALCGGSRVLLSSICL